MLVHLVIIFSVLIGHAHYIYFYTCTPTQTEVTQEYKAICEPITSLTSTASSLMYVCVACILHTGCHKANLHVYTCLDHDNLLQSYIMCIDGLVQNYCNYLILYKKLQQFCTKPSLQTISRGHRIFFNRNTFSANVDMVNINAC